MQKCSVKCRGAIVCYLLYGFVNRLCDVAEGHGVSSMQTIIQTGSYEYEYELMGTGYPPQHIASDLLGHEGFTFS
jgi:hypothetical protein